MTREELVEKVASIEANYYGDLCDYTQRVFTLDFPRYVHKDYIYEGTFLKGYLHTYKRLLEIMREDLVDHDVLSRVNYLIEKRIKTIENERKQSINQED